MMILIKTNTCTGCAVRGYKEAGEKRPEPPPPPPPPKPEPPKVEITKFTPPKIVKDEEVKSHLLPRKN
jgi:hypothetical protein